MKRLTTALLLILMIIQAMLTVQADEKSGRIAIEFDKTAVKTGEYFEATIKVENINAEYIVIPVHFNSKAVKVADKAGDLVISGIKTASEARDGSIGVTPLQALSSETDENGDPKYWNGAIFENPAYTEINNEDGFCRLMFSNVKTKEIVSETLVSIKFVAIGKGDADIRFATSRDEFHDLTAENGAKYIQGNIENPMEAAISMEFSEINIPKLNITESETEVTPPVIQRPQTGGGGGATGTFTPPAAVNNILNVEFTEKEIENLLPRAADETKNSLIIKLEAENTVTKIIIKLPAAVIEKSLSALVFTTEFDTPLGKAGFDNQEIFDKITENSKFVICTVTKDSSEITIEEKSPEELAGKSFEDLPKEHWAYDFIMTLVYSGHLNGMNDTEFAPDVNITREQFAKMLVSACDIFSGTASCDFIDLDEGHWAYRYIASAVGEGIISGYDDGSFGLERNITRQEMAVMVARAKTNLPEKVQAADFSDQDEIADWAASSVLKMQRADIINGMPDGSFAPNANATRAQAAKIIYSIVLQ